MKIDCEVSQNRPLEYVSMVFLFSLCSIKFFLFDLVYFLIVNFNLIWFQIWLFCNWNYFSSPFMNLVFNLHEKNRWRLFEVVVLKIDFEMSQNRSLFIFFLRSIKLLLLALVYFLIVNLNLIWFQIWLFLKLELLLLSVSEFSIELTWKAPVTIAGGCLQDWFWNITKSISLYALLFLYFLCVQSNSFASSCIFFCSWTSIWSDFKFDFSVIGVTFAYVPFLDRRVHANRYFSGFPFCSQKDRVDC